MYISVFAIFCSILALSAVLLLWRKLGRIGRDVWAIDLRIGDLLKNEFRQSEALYALNQILRPQYPLPPTRSWAGSPDFLFAIAQYAMENRPANILECSCGTSTVVLARCAQLNSHGHIYSLESDPKFAEITRQELCRHGLESFATILYAPLTQHDIDDVIRQWYSLDTLPDFPIDMLVIDGPPSISDPLARFPAGPMLIGRMTKGGAIFLDDADRLGEREIVSRWQESFPTIDIEQLRCEKGLIRISIPI